MVLADEPDVAPQGSDRPLGGCPKTEAPQQAIAPPDPSQSGNALHLS
ncbi:hypothetical protein [Phormidium sp. CCY1219]|nr:hypothetical protein [Phormidium sp. CCY1219]